MKRRPGKVAITLRLPDDVHAHMQQIAKAEERSLTGQIVWMLREGIDRRVRERGPDKADDQAASPDR